MIVFCCHPMESWIQEQIESCRRERRAEEFELDVQWGIDNGLHDEEMDIQHVPVELLGCIQPVE